MKLAPVILEQAALGFEKSVLVDSFFKYVLESEQVIFESCFLFVSHFEGVDQGKFLEIIDIHNCQGFPTRDNIEQILRELAHQKN